MRNLLFIHGAGNDGSVWSDVKKRLLRLRIIKYIHRIFPDMQANMENVTALMHIATGL